MKKGSSQKKKAESSAPQFQFDAKSSTIPQRVFFEYPQHCQGITYPTSQSSRHIFYQELQRKAPCFNKFLKDSIQQNKRKLLEKIRQQQRQGDSQCRKEKIAQEKLLQIDASSYKLDKSSVDEYIKNDPINKISTFATQGIRVNQKKMMKDCQLTYRELKNILTNEPRYLLYYSMQHSKLEKQCQNLGSNVTQTLKNIRNFYDARKARLQQYFKDAHQYTLKNLFQQNEESQSQDEN